jgi:predicted permease
MFVDLALFASFAALGVWLQRGTHGDALRGRLWTINYVLFIPLAATYAFLSLELDRHLLALVGCWVVAWWLTVALAGTVAAAATRDRTRRGALWMVGAFPNTGFIGFPLANLAYGTDGLRLAIVYDQVSLLVPAIVVSTLIARQHAGVTSRAMARPRRSLLREVLASPPLWTVLVLVALRVSLVPDPVHVGWLGTFVAHTVGPVGFLLLGLSIPLEGFVHDRIEVAQSSAAMLVRVAAAPALVWLVAHVAGVDVLRSLYLIAAMPTAFHALVLSRLHDLEVAIVRLGVLVTSVVVVVGTVTLVALR